MTMEAPPGWQPHQIVSRIDAEMPLAPADAQYRGEVAERWAYRDGSGEVGVIASVTQAFCRDCTRARLATDGKLYTCLFATTGHDLRALLRAGWPEERDPDPEWLKAHLARLRSKLDAAGAPPLANVRGVGYRLG